MGGEALATELPWLPWMRISLPRHDLLGEKRLTNLSEEKGLKPLSQWAFIEFNLHRDAYQRMEVFLDHRGPFESGSGRQGDADWL